MGSFAGVSIDAQNLQQAVSLAEQKKILAEQTRQYQLSQSLADYRNSLPTMVSDVKIAMPQYDYSNNVLVENSFPDGQYYVVTDFVSTEIPFQGGLAPRPNEIKALPVKKTFKKGDLVNVETVITSTALTKAKAIKTPMGNFSFNVNDLSKTKPMENIVPEFSLEAKEKNQNKLIIMVIGAFILGYLLSND